MTNKLKLPPSPVRRTVELLLVLSVFAAISTVARGATDARVYIPHWEQGMTWSVELEPTELPNTGFDPTPPNPLEKPVAGPGVVWKFEIEKVVDVNPKARLYQMKVRQKDESSMTSADLVFAGELDDAGRMIALYVVKADYRYPVKGDETEIRRDYNKMSNGPFPVINDVNSVPCDFPYFYVPDATQDLTKSDGIWKEFKYERGLYEEVYLYTVRQTILLNAEKVVRPDVYKVEVDRTKNQDVYIRLKPDEHVVRLVFNSDHPWPVFGEGPKGRFWLLPDGDGKKPKQN